MSELVSIIVPVFNCREYICDCVESILAQNHADIEIIIVDDGSADGSTEICDEYAIQYPNIVVFHKTNGGLSDARNTGVMLANSEYVTFVDADDIVGPQMASIMLRLANQEKADIVKVTIIRKNDEDVIKPTEDGYRVISPEMALQRIYIDPPQIISGCGKLFARKLFEHIRFPVGMYYEDEYTVPKLYAIANRIVFSNSVQYFYMQRPTDSIMRGAFTEEKCHDALKVVQDRILFFETLNNNELLRAAKKDYYLKLLSLRKKCGEAFLLQSEKELGKNIKEFRKKETALYIAVLSRQGIYRLMMKFKKFKTKIKKKRY